MNDTDFFASSQREKDFPFVRVVDEYKATPIENRKLPMDKRVFDSDGESSDSATVDWRDALKMKRARVRAAKEKLKTAASELDKSRDKLRQHLSRQTPNTRPESGERD